MNLPTAEKFSVFLTFVPALWLSTEYIADAHTWFPTVTQIDIQLRVMLLPSTFPQSHTWADMLSSVDTTHTVHTHIHTLTIHTPYKRHTHTSHACILSNPYTSYTTPTNTTQNTHKDTHTYKYTHSHLLSTCPTYNHPHYSIKLCATQFFTDWWNSLCIDFTGTIFFTA